MKTILLAIIFGISVITVNAQKKTMKSLDYIGLVNTTKFRNGDTIYEAKSQAEWVYACEKGIPAWCYYNNDSTLGNRLGKIYNYFAIHDSRGLLPKGYVIPTKERFEQLIDHNQKELFKEVNQGDAILVYKDSIIGGIRNRDGAFYHSTMAKTWWTSSEEDDNELYDGEIYGVTYLEKFNEFTLLGFFKCTGMYVIGVRE